MYFINKILTSSLKAGKKQQAENVLISVLSKLKLVNKKSISEISRGVESNTTSVIELIQPTGRRKQRKYPSFLSFLRSKRVAARTLIKSVLHKGKDNLSDSLFSELVDSFEGKGLSVKSKQSLYEFVLENKVFWRKLASKKKKKKRKKIRRF